ncbi:GntR family transcriptional regulator [uncultured Clostridium sp.]|nr:GntR family transcriptional regulator [uncultured Clostridium sp.]
MKNQIIKMIADGDLKEGEALPSVRVLASYLDVNMHTVNKSYSILKKDGFIKIEPGKGAFVNLNLNKSNNEFKESLKSFVNSLGAECFIRGISKDELINIVNEEFPLYPLKK